MKSWTNGLIIFCIFFMVICSYFIYREFDGSIEKTDGEKIGTITFKNRSASRRYTDNVMWEEVEQHSEIYNYDVIRTMEYSSAVIELKNGTKIELDQNTLLVVILNDKGININFGQGGISAQSGDGTKGTVTINSKDAMIVLDKGELSINSSDTGMDVYVNSGNAKIAARGKELNILPGDIATLKNGVAESEKASIFPEFPKNNSNLITFGELLSLTLSWRSESSGEVMVEVSHNRDFKNIVKNYKSLKSNLSVKLPQGDYYWRLVRENIKSMPYKFSILADSKPFLIAPHADQKISITEGLEFVMFRWGKSEYASAYELVAARDIKMTDVVLTMNSRSSIISAPGLGAGRYYWTVRSIYSPGVIAETALAGPGMFYVEKLNFSQAKPVPLDQGPVTTAGPFILNWIGVQDFKSYNVEISSDQEFKSILAVKNTVNTFVKIDEKLPEGNYYWRVSALSGDESPTTSITALLLLIGPLQIIAVNPASGVVMFNKPDTINFSWRDPNNGEKYLVEISDSSSFRNIKQSRESTVQELHMESPGKGNFFWRVILKDHSGNVVAKSSVSDFTIPDDLEIPVSVIPKDNEKIIHGLKRELRFEWREISGANEYEVEIFKRMGGVDKPLTIYSSKKNYIGLLNTSIFIPGNYSWIIRAKDVRNGRVRAFKESRKSYFEIKEVALLPAPKVKNPGVIFK